MTSGAAGEERQIGVRELRQHASRYLRRVAAGESFSVTDRGRPVALLVPTVEHGVGAMIARGELLAPDHPTGVLSGSLPEPLDLGFNASAELQRMRDEDRP